MFSGQLSRFGVSGRRADQGRRAKPDYPRAAPPPPQKSSATCCSFRNFHIRQQSQTGARFLLCKGKRLCYTLRARELLYRSFLGSSAVEHPTVNRMVAGSNPARGARSFQDIDRHGGTGVAQVPQKYILFLALTRHGTTPEGAMRAASAGRTAGRPRRFSET